MKQSIPVIDLFAGPGGLGEGFSCLKSNGKDAFKVKLSIEKDKNAHQTLMLRAIFRSFEGRVPDSYYDYITGKLAKNEFFNLKSIAGHIAQAADEAKNATLGSTPARDIDHWIEENIRNQSKWVLIGGPPCQAYSLVGRAKMMNSDLEKYESDSRHLLYKEYLRIIKVHTPPVFIMENVKGILSSKLHGEFIFKKITRDLSNPKKGLEYEIRSLTVDNACESLDPGDLIIRSELYGIPQARHRVIILGVRKDLAKRRHRVLQEAKWSTFDNVLQHMPKLRSKLSKEVDSHKDWHKALHSTISMLSGWNPEHKKLLLSEMEKSSRLSSELLATGAPFLQSRIRKVKNAELSDWLIDGRIGGFIQHESRSHMRSDIQRYFLLSNYAKIIRRSPKLGELPQRLLPNHRNARYENTPFQDRFRVQLGGQPSTTIVSHIAKDGHYYIHPDPAQARSLTVREAARLQTFPDNYYFEGNRTAQYAQVGNAVPPLLAYKIAEIVYHFLNA